MDYHAQQAPRPSIASLLRGIIADVRNLFVYELTATKLEIQEELDQAKKVAASLSIGAGVSAVGGLLLALMLVHMLAAHTDVPLWGCYGIVGGILTVLGAMLLYSGRRRTGRVHLTSQQRTETAQEDIRWNKDHLMSGRT
jgi:protein-S-isoprenylcysteine O-methyltransferase Ste14